MSRDLSISIILRIATAACFGAFVVLLLAAAGARADAGQFQQTDTLATEGTAGNGNNARALASDDFNGDGIDDVAAVSSNSTNEVGVLLGTGDGQVGARADYAVDVSPGGTSNDVIAADLDGDGNPDLIAAGTYGVSVLLNQGGGAFDAPAVTSASGSNITSIGVGDFDDDGELDIIGAAGGTSQLFFFKGSSDGALVAPTQIPTDATGTVGGTTASGFLYPEGLADGADVDVDGDDDILLGATFQSGGSYYHGAAVIRSNGDGTFATGSFYQDQTNNANNFAAAVGDIDGDGAPDLAIKNSLSVTSVFSNLDDGNGTLSLTDSFTGASSLDVSFDDFDLDGFDDLLVGNGDSAGVAFSNGDGTFTDPLYTQTVADGRTLVSGDFGSDDYPDIAAAGFSSEGTDNGTILSNQPVADLSTTLDDSADPVVVGDSYSYRATVGNTGPDTATRANVRFSIPEETTYDDAATDAFNGADVCDATSGGAVSCDLGDIANGDTGVVSVVVTADSPGSATSDATALTAVNDPATGNNTDDEQTTLTAPTLSVTGPGSVDEGAGTATFTVNLDAAASADAGFDYATADGTATAGSDYTPSSGTGTIPAGDTSVDIAVPITDDTLDEVDETFDLRISNPTGGAVIGSGSSTATTTIADDDDPPAVTITDASVGEGNAGTSDAVFDVNLSAPSAKPVTVAYATADETATAPSDYAATGGDLSFAPRLDQ